MTIDITPEEAQSFLRFRQVQDTFEILERAGVFNVRNGRATLNFDQNGTLCDIECAMKLYKRGTDIIPIIIDLHTPT